MRTDQINDRRGRLGLRSSRAVFGVLVAIALLVAACGSDDEQSAQEKYCESGEQLESSVASLTSIDPIAEGADGIESALDQVLEDAETMRDNASDAAEDEVSALEDAIDETRDAVESLGGDITADNAAAVVSGIDQIQTAATAVAATLSDCP